ncbi:hypothetical protein F9U64_01430 [Gracilibacillus oryzae]|uniref:Uncharacterized protein n=1 Tax=Gracilibacillus oryzae TaxID=1672701 RepID=A0A7C8GVF2_9BACI|nr:hypothetical protein [Gracilibacillus oryzae]KAB8139086.1 hypothetical protein F9U64_01430 [Gracilibacillus oryzae]
MSEKKKVIYVKDLVIKADNVRIEPSHHHRPDPFFGPRRGETLGEAEEKEHHEEVEDIAEENDDDKKDHDDDRRPFSWI